MFDIKDIINTLNQIEVKGKDNLDKMLGAILALEQIYQAQNTTQEIQITEDKGE